MIAAPCEALSVPSAALNNKTPNSSPFATVVDSQATITNGKQVTIYCWYDNEYGYSKQVISLAKKVSNITLPRLPKPIS